jgi:hypothetical protein
MILEFYFKKKKSDKFLSNKNFSFLLKFSKNNEQISSFLDTFSKLKSKIQVSDNVDKLFRNVFKKSVSGKSICDFLENNFGWSRENSKDISKKMFQE